jgi:NAD(P)H-hydrate epimerase
LLGSDLTKSDLIYLLILLEKKYAREAPHGRWSRYYATYLVEKYLCKTIPDSMDSPFYSGEIPYLTTDQMVEVDRAMIDEFEIKLLQMMENAGRNLAHLARNRFLDGDPRGKKVVVLAGSGGNGGGALVCARRLSNYGADVQIIITKAEDDFTPVPRHQLNILRRMSLPIALASSLHEIAFSDLDLIVDGIIGYSLKGSPRGSAAQLIRWANAQDAPILALDAPSGVDTTSGTVFNPAIQAMATMTLALPKEGLVAAGVEAKVGELYLADISVPPQLYAEPALALKVGTIFATADIVRLR